MINPTLLFEQSTMSYTRLDCLMLRIRQFLFIHFGTCLISCSNLPSQNWYDRLVLIKTAVVLSDINRTSMISNYRITTNQYAQTDKVAVLLQEDQCYPVNNGNRSSKLPLCAAKYGQCPFNSTELLVTFLGREDPRVEKLTVFTSLFPHSLC